MSAPNAVETSESDLWALDDLHEYARKSVRHCEQDDPSSATQWRRRANALSCLVAEVRSLRADKARLDWLEKHGEAVSWIDPESDASACHLVYSVDGERPDDDASGDTLREAIDEAIAVLDDTEGVA